MSPSFRFRHPTFTPQDSIFAVLGGFSERIVMQSLQRDFPPTKSRRAMTLPYVGRLQQGAMKDHRQGQPYWPSIAISSNREPTTAIGVGGSRIGPGPCFGWRSSFQSWDQRHEFPAMLAHTRALLTASPLVKGIVIIPVPSGRR